ncbi:hypothetical protein EA462_07430 [Natrarchaeobius halalkaliphilus]|uniref:Uncharacterized protein n=2 Tax=Natrarchaeobius halalkaliphilus TaxID=1679091 RepID=A0A3N6M3Q7_9EURY|nr:hypothetical protein EA462_07430 [Natrarchaeobius halalkaliphilus]
MAIVDGHQQTTEVGAAENELSLVGSKISEVTLGESTAQTVSVSGQSGTYGVNETAGRMEITHYNRTGTDTGELIGNETFSLGEITYATDGETIAYQGGGVWKHDGDHTTMVSPPEFHYRYGTLTLPIINVTGDGQRTGKTDIVAQRTSETERIFPNSSRTYDDGTVYQNPIENGTVEVTVHSEYYLGWERYFQDRTQGNVSVDHENETVNVELITLGDQGLTPLSDGGDIRIRAAQEDDPINEFTLTLAGDGSSGLNNLDWSLEVDGTEVANVHGQGHGGVDTTITDATGEEWTAEDAFEVNQSADPETVTINLTSDVIAQNASGSERELGALFNETIEAYGPNVDLTVEDKSGAQRVDHDESEGYIDYEAEGFVTYLQITENTADVRFS